MSTPQDLQDPLALDKQVSYSLVVAARSVTALYRPILDPLGLTHPQYLVLLALWARGPRSVKDLSHELQLDSATLSPLLKRLEAMGHVWRVRRATDERVLEIGLTDQGRALRERAVSIPQQIRDRLSMTEEQLEGLKTVLSQVIDNAKALPETI